MRTSLIERVLGAIGRHKMFTAGQRVGVGVSGGSDSVALLWLLVALAPRLGVRLSIAHFNHQLRAEEADGDERFAAALAHQLGLPFHVGREDVAQLARQQGWNVEDAARRARYAFFASLVETGKLERIAVAHTADDQAETVLTRLARGTGPTGLAAIYPLNGHVVRPLMEVRRQELRDYLTAIGQTWREDSSNTDTSRLRARLRQNVLPLLERELQPALVANLNRLAQMARQDEAFWRALVRDRLQELVRREGNRCAIRSVDLLSPLPWKSVALPAEARLALTRRLVRAIIQELRGNCLDLTATHVEQVLRLTSANASGRRVELPGAVAERSFEWVWFSLTPPCVETDHGASRPNASLIREFSHTVELCNLGESTVVAVPQIGRQFHLKVIDWHPGERETIDSIGQGALDRDLLGSPLVLRNWRPGDAFRPQGRRSSHKLKDFLQASRVPVRDRVRWPVLTTRDAVVWTRGLPPAVDFAPSKTTRVAVVVIEEEM